MTSAKNKLINIILINNNGYVDTIDCMNSILDNSYKNFRVIIVDNNSNDKSVDQIIKWSGNSVRLTIVDYSNNIFKNISPDKKNLTNKKSLKEFVLIKSSEARGFAANNNIGIRYCLSQKQDEYFWLLNNDTIIQKNSLVELVNLLQKEDEIGIVGSKLLFYDEPSKVQTFGNEKVNWKGIGHSAYDGIDANAKLPEYIELKTIVGASMLIKPEVIQEIGLMDEDYFMYHEESDWCFKARQAGYKLLANPRSVILHKEGRSTDRKRMKKKFLWLTASRTSIVDFLIWGYYSFRNEIYFVKKNYKKMFILYMFFSLPKTYIVKTISIFLFNDDHKLMRLYLINRAVFDGLFTRMGMSINVGAWKKKFL